MNQKNKISVCMVINVINRYQETCFNGVNNSKTVNGKFYLCSVTSLQHFHMPPSFLSAFSLSKLKSIGSSFMTSRRSWTFSFFQDIPRDFRGDFCFADFALAILNKESTHALKDSC